MRKHTNMKTDTKTKAAPTILTTQVRPTRLYGFTPLVEASTDGSKLDLLTNETLTIPWLRRVEHILAVGKTGSGKSTRWILPIIFADIADLDRTVIIIDAQATDVHRIIEYTRMVRGPNAKIIYFNPQDPDFSLRWNPFAGLVRRKDTDDMAQTMTASVEERDEDSPYFRMQAALFLSAMTRALNKTTNGQATGGKLLDLLDRGHKTIAQLAAKTGQRQLESFLSHLNNGNRNDETTMSMLHNLLLAWNDEDVDETTSRSDFDFAVLDDEPCVVIYAIPEECVQRLRPITNAFLHRLFHFVMERGRTNGGSLRRPISLIVDEFASAVGEIPTFHLRANTLRKRGLAITAAVQSLEQIYEVYKQTSKSLLAAFNHLVLIPPVSLEDAAHASKLSGEITVDEIVTSDGCTPVNVIPTKRPLLTPSDIANAEHHERLGPKITFLLKNTPAFQGWLWPAYENPKYRDLMAKTMAGHLPLPAQVRSQPNHDWDWSEAGLALPPAFTDTTGWTDAQIRKRLSAVKREIGWDHTTGSARKWFEAFEQENQTRPALVLRLAEELHIRKATITEFFLAYVYSNTDNVQANLLYLDYTRLKKAEEKKRRESLSWGRQPHQDR
jgi:hypothetical protein